MKALRISIYALAATLGLALIAEAQGPINTGGPTVARPKQGPQQPVEEELDPIESEFKPNAEGPAPLATYSVDATTISVDVTVVDKDGRFIPDLPREFFRIKEDDEPQRIQEFSQGEAPITVALVIEFSNLFQQYYSDPWYETKLAANQFAQSLGPEDYLAVVAYDLRPEILSDFTADRRQTADALARLNVPGFSEANLFDAITYTAERMQDIEGRKAIVVISSGMDTLSRLNFGETRKIIQNAGVPVYSIGIMQAMRTYLDAGGFLSNSARMDFMMADNQLRTFSKESGGMAFFPRFYGEFPIIFNQISQALRSQYVLTYQPTNQARDGKFREIEVELVAPESGDKLKILDQDGKQVKYDIIAKKGYQAPREVE